MINAKHIDKQIDSKTTRNGYHEPTQHTLSKMAIKKSMGATTYSNIW